MILKKAHAYLQTILTGPVKFQKDRTKAVGGVKGTKYLLKIRNHAPRTTESRKQCPSAFLRKGGGQILKKKQQKTCISSGHPKSPCKVSKGLAKNCGRS